ncbi:hypothetical protein E4U41_002282 [Claviceps citrina]|nr:hypothetical protein E4U41_002282 [Claviceps citrina]
MKSIALVTVLAITTTVLAAPPQNAIHDVFIREVDTQTPAMTDKQGNVVPFDANDVHLANEDAGIE